jgi:hypothetical protein
MEDLKTQPLLLKSGAKLRRTGNKRGTYYIIGYGGMQLSKALALIQ